MAVSRGGLQILPGQQQDKETFLFQVSQNVGVLHEKHLEHSVVVLFGDV